MEREILLSGALTILSLSYSCSFSSLSAPSLHYFLIHSLLLPLAPHLLTVPFQLSPTPLPSRSFSSLSAPFLHYFLTHSLLLPLAPQPTNCSFLAQPYPSAFQQLLVPICSFLHYFLTHSWLLPLAPQPTHCSFLAQPYPLPSSSFSSAFCFYQYTQLLNHSLILPFYLLISSPFSLNSTFLHSNPFS